VSTITTLPKREPRPKPEPASPPQAEELCPEPYPVLNAVECKACGRCVAACPRGLLRMSREFNERGSHYVEYVGEGCTACADCYYTCPEPATIEIHMPKGCKARDNRRGE